MCVCVIYLHSHTHTHIKSCAMACAWRSKDNFGGWVLSFHDVGPKNNGRMDSAVVLVSSLLSQHKQDGAALLCSSKRPAVHTASLLQVGPGSDSRGRAKLEGVPRTGMYVRLLEGPPCLC